MIRVNTILLTAALSLIISANAVQAANIQISSLPFTISAPGTYKVTANLTCPAAETAITINSSIAGAIIVNLEGFTLNANPNTGSLVSGIQITGNSTASSITILNGNIVNFNVGIGAGVIEDPAVTALLLKHEPLEDLYDEQNSSYCSPCHVNKRIYSASRRRLDGFGQSRNCSDDTHR
jgi:hypothetical protein